MLYHPLRSRDIKANKLYQVLQTYPTTPSSSMANNAIDFPLLLTCYQYRLSNTPILAHCGLNPTPEERHVENIMKLTVLLWQAQLI